MFGVEAALITSGLSAIHLAGGLMLGRWLWKDPKPRWAIQNGQRRAEHLASRLQDLRDLLDREAHVSELKQICQTLNQLQAPAARQMAALLAEAVERLNHDNRQIQEQVASLCSTLVPPSRTSQITVESAQPLAAPRVGAGAKSRVTASHETAPVAVLESPYGSAGLRGEQIGQQVLEHLRGLPSSSDGSELSGRYPYPRVLLIAPYLGSALPDESRFAMVPCHDISTTGISFYWPRRPAFDYVVVGLGEEPGGVKKPNVTYYTARVEHVRAVDSASGKYLLGCQFIGRVTI
jgi:hypothetical protein